MQQAAMMFIASQLMSRKEKENLTAIFMALDKNGDGSLTRDELLEGYTKLYKNRERARAEVESLMAIADVDNNGLIDYSEFLLATGNKKEMLSKENVKQAFDLFDIVTFKYFLNRIRVALYQPAKLRKYLVLEGDFQKIFGEK